MDKNKLEQWLNVLNYWNELIKDDGERYPSQATWVKRYNDMINEIYNLTKKGA